MRNDEANDRRRRVPLPKDVSFPQAAEAVKLLLRKGWKWKDARWQLAPQCWHCDERSWRRGFIFKDGYCKPCYKLTQTGIVRQAEF
jgi:hypothetical protein